MERIKLLVIIFLLLIAACRNHSNLKILEADDRYIINTPNYQLQIIKEGFRFSFSDGEGNVIVPAHEESGLLLLEGVPSNTDLILETDNHLQFQVVTSKQDTFKVHLRIADNYVKLNVEPESNPGRKGRMIARTEGIGPAFGMGEHAGYPKHPYSPAGTELTGYTNDTILACIGDHFVGRLVSNFVIFPQTGFAEVNVEPFVKIVHITADENAQGSNLINRIDAMYYFIGDVKTIYKEFLEARNREGFKVCKPKYDLFGVGWEAWGALGWNTNQETVTDYINKFVRHGYPLSWGVVGSGFWPKSSPEYMATTSFGMWDTFLYPDPQGLFEMFHQHGMKVLTGLRIAFLEGGPYTEEGLKKGYFIKDKNGNSCIIRVGFPKGKTYLLDGQNGDAVEWYVDLCQKWLDYGVDGFKEDQFGFHWDLLRDDKVDNINEKLMDQGVYVMGRNMYLGSPADLHRFEDFNYDHQQDRGPISSLALAYSGFPYVYPDVVGGAPNYANSERITNRFKTYLMRLARYASVNPSMAYGFGPWETGDSLVIEVCRDAAMFHASIQPYIYDAALKTYESGFPYTLTPLSLVFPGDPNVYDREDTITRGYQWMIGESILACPLYGNDYMTATTRDIYLPEGEWMDFNTGEIFNGPDFLEDYPLPVTSTPVFIGGKGVVLKSDLSGGKLVVEVFPVSPSGTEVTFILPDGENGCSVANNIQSWNDSCRIMGDTEMVEYTINPVTTAINFNIEPGVSYILSNTN